MYDIRQFRPALYVLLMLGLSGFALAARSPGLWVLSICVVGLNAWLLAAGRFRPIPRLLANAVTIVAMLYVAHELATSPTTPVIVIGKFLVFLQLVKLWEQRGNRDYAQLLVLSLLLIVAASMNTASLWFGIILVTYLFLSLYCCLLFHLKVETDAAKAALPVPEEKISPGTLRQDQQFLARSMRRLTALVSSVAMAFAVVVFLLFPRGNGGMLGPLQTFHGGSALTGFSDQVSFQDVARITQNHDTVAYAKVWHNDQLVTGNQALLLRGLTLDTYRAPVRPGGSWDWTRTTNPPPPHTATPEDPLLIKPAGADQWRQQVALWPTHTDVLFAMAGPVRFTPRIPIKLRYSPEDGALQTTSALIDRIDYEVISSNELGTADDAPVEQVPGNILRERFPRIFEFARRPEVCGSGTGVSLADQRILQGNVSPLDGQIAQNIQEYLRTHFTYTLDLTDEGSFRGREPLEAFLYDWKRGHCEYFAGAMTLMCQSLGMQARVVIGFKCDGDSYNGMNNLYSVRDSDAHAWVEVKTPQGWKSFDPTSSQSTALASQSGLMSGARHLLEYVEFSYANAIVAYDNQSRDSVIASVETTMTTTASAVAMFLARVEDFLARSRMTQHIAAVAALSAALIALAVAALGGRTLLQRWVLRQRAQRIGINSLPQAEQLRLAQQLGFYDEMLRLLLRHRIVRQPHATPLEFSRSLAFLPSEAYDMIQRLTVLFYKVRYGGTELPAGRQRWLRNALSRLGQELASAQGTGPTS